MARRRAVHFRLVSGALACGAPAYPATQTTVDAARVTCPDCRRRETLTAAEIFSSWRAKSPGRKGA